MAHFEEEKDKSSFIFVLFLLFLNNQKLYKCKCSLHEKQETVKKSLLKLFHYSLFLKLEMQSRHVDPYP
jgi:hypothetical protein